MSSAAPWFAPRPPTPPGTCEARRVHPLSSDYYVRCERKTGHAEDHVNDGVEWTDDSAYALPRTAA